MEITRRNFLSSAAVGAGSALGIPAWADYPVVVPSYLEGYENLYRKNPKAAALEWLVKSRWGLFIHYYSLHSLRGITARDASARKGKGKDEWKNFKQGALEEYARLEKTFTAARFDADFITDLALSAQMG